MNRAELARQGWGVIAFVPSHASKEKPGDRAEFERQAREFLASMPSSCPTRLVVFPSNVAGPARAQFVVDAIHGERDDNLPPLGVVAFFCHGWASGLQAAPALALAQPIAKAIASQATTDVSVALYACSTAGDGKRATNDETSKSDAPGGDGGFADRLRDELCAAGAVDCVVDAHSVAGHTTRNAFVRRFAGHGSRLGGIGGLWLVTPSSVRWRAWQRALKAAHGLALHSEPVTLRWRFPLMSALEIHEELAATP